MLPLGWPQFTADCISTQHDDSIVQTVCLVRQHLIVSLQLTAGTLKSGDLPLHLIDFCPECFVLIAKSIHEAFSYSQVAIVLLKALEIITRHLVCLPEKICQPKKRHEHEKHANA